MTYQRVIPRDLFNEAKLLKCLGRLVIVADAYAMLTVTHDGEPFDIQQSVDGDLYCENVEVRYRYGNLLENPTTPAQTIGVFNPINSREDWPLLFEDDGGEHRHVFRQDDPNGNLSEAFLCHIGHA